MLNARNLDDQRYDEIVRAAVGRLPWLCPEWTDHNAHDPGITILELMAWYKELQQYHMNQFTEELQCTLLKLAGIRRKPAAPARCAVEVGTEVAAKPAGARLRTTEGIPFELAEAIPAQRAAVKRVLVMHGETPVDVGHMLAKQRITFQPFDSAEKGVLCLGLAGWTEGPLRLWFDVEKPAGAVRNPFAEPDQVPRIIQWHCKGASAAQVQADGTHALSQSGYVTLEPSPDWPEQADGLHWLTLTLEDPGCEEAVRLSGVTANRYQAIQQETWAKSHSFRAGERRNWRFLLSDAQALNGELAVFLRTAKGWTQTDRWSDSLRAAGRRVVADTTGAVQDGTDNVLILSLDRHHLHSMLFDTKGLPGETLQLDLNGRTVLRETFTLLCETLDRDGIVKPMLWRCVDDLAACGPRDHVFTYDPLRETITFGDGAHGSLLRRGEGAVLAADMVLSCCGGGNVPGGCVMSFEEDGCRVEHSPAAGGAAQESVAEARDRLLRMLSTSRKCVSAEDYERLARETPGLRVAAAKALPAYDPEEPTGRSILPTVTVVVVPAGTGECPLPDQRFLTAVQRHLDRCRPIGIRVRAAAPVYADISLHVVLCVKETSLEEQAVQAVREHLASAGIGAVLRVSNLRAALQALPGVLQVKAAELRCAAPGCRRNGSEELILPRRAIPRLKTCQIACIPQEGTNHTFS